VDGLLGYTFTSVEKDLLDKTMELFETYIRMVVLWLNKIQKMG
jgi:hypothetical protein